MLEDFATGKSRYFLHAGWGEGGCTALLDCTATCTDAARLGHPLYQAPEVLRARREAKIAYSPAGASPPLQPTCNWLPQKFCDVLPTEAHPDVSHDMRGGKG